jgi:hypothetical protein
MSLVPEDLTKWDNESLLRTFERNQETLQVLVGSLYPSILHEENEKIGQECIRRTNHHPNWWREKGIVESTWTGPDGLVHTWVHMHGGSGVHRGRADDPAKIVTCFECLAR